MKTKSKSKTFNKGDDFQDVADFFIGKNIETEDVQPEGTESYADGLTPFDVRCELKHKYIITITKVLE
jgi:hypothetical protein